MEKNLGQIQSDSQSTRRAERASIFRQVVVRLWPDDGKTTDLDVDLTDFTAFGVGFSCQRKLERGQQFTLHFRRTEGSAPEVTPASLLYSVAHCQSADDQRYQVGAEFICVTPQKSEVVKPPSSDQEQAAKKIRRAILT
jgi:hypothetical protein